MIEDIFTKKQQFKIPNKKKVAVWVDDLFEWLFLNESQVTFNSFNEKGTLL